MANIVGKRRYSDSDKAKMVRDKMEDYRSKGIDARGLCPTHPGGVMETIKSIDSEINCTKDQSQEQVGRSKEKHAQIVNAGRERCRDIARKYPDGPKKD